MQAMDAPECALGARYGLRVFFIGAQALGHAPGLNVALLHHEVE